MSSSGDDKCQKSLVVKLFPHRHECLGSGNKFHQERSTRCEDILSIKDNIISIGQEGFGFKFNVRREFGSNTCLVISRSLTKRDDWC